MRNLKKSKSLEKVSKINSQKLGKLTNSAFLGPTVAAVFATLSQDDQPGSASSDDKTKDIDEIISNAKTVNGLLSIAETNKDITRKHALKVPKQK